ncbi:Imm1 family immunity protein [Saccharothrix xinjiangensis]|uniref:Imm1 family immunity protein n=1 Tax=Saccharothrix xinjiangensis TaxID=204798 RepID=A0ABV9YAJ1_9PSEU
MATLNVTYDRITGEHPFTIDTHQDVDVLLDRLRALADVGPVPPLAEVVVAEDPFGTPFLYVGIGKDSGWVREPGEPDRWTHGEPDATGTMLYDYVGHGEDIPTRHIVPLNTVRAVLTTYLDHNGTVPNDDPHLHPVA